MTIVIGIILVYLCSVGFSAKYREKYAAEKEQVVKLEQEKLQLINSYESELIRAYNIAKEHGWKGDL